MTFTLQCPNCRAVLELDAAPGGSIRCAACGHQFRPDSLSIAAPVESIASLRIPEGRIYGPMPLDQLEEWICQGRVDDKCDVRLTLNGPWQSAATIFPVLQLPPTVSSGNPFKIEPKPLANAASASRLSERGIMIVLFGVLGWVGCPVFAVLAWGMGASDLEAHREGRLDTRSVLITQIGYFLGMFGAITWATAILGTVLMILLHQLTI
ncbi:hypothetical protein [Blastopirellula marina]|uniref:hypothetical protein n=1 Tax=Blastopirellula marina TaxID=124 RepID=UPI000320B4D5|nr:hypothetical protein [Blastopirellula marina]